MSSDTASPGPSEPRTGSVAVREDVSGDRVVIVLDGEFDGFTADRVRATARALEVHVGLGVHIDAAAVSFASAGLVGALLELREHVIDRGGTVTLIASSPILDRVLMITQTGRLLPVQRPPGRDP